MKKIIILFLLIFSLSGCYDYTEIVDFAIVVSVGVDYKDDNFTTTFEILSSNNDKESPASETFTVSGKGPTISKAFENTDSKINKRAYYTHADLFVLSEEVARSKLADISDFLLRNSHIRENFNVVIAKDPKEILESSSKINPTVGKSIIDAIKGNQLGNNVSLDKNFTVIMQEIFEYGKDTAIPIINFKDDEIILEGIGLFDDYKMVAKLSRANSSIYNIVSQETIKRIIFSKDYDGKTFSNSVFYSNISTELTNKKIKVTGYVEAEISNNVPDFNVRDSETLKKIEADFADIVNKEIINLIKLLQDEDSDILALTQGYYIKTREKNDNLWRFVDVESNVVFRISKKGITYGGKDDKQ